MAENFIRPRPLHMKAIALGKIIERQRPELNSAEAIVQALVYYAKQRIK